MLFDHIVARGQYSEKDAANIVRQILEGVSYMHNNGIAHRDLKPENLLAMDDNCDIVKISDFGLSKEFLGDNNLHTACGTPEYAAPEVVSAMGTYDHAVDIWSIGVITYILLCGYPPFYDPGEQQGKLFEQITAGRYEFPSGDWDGISAEAKDFIRNILVTDPQRRMTSKQCLQHSWLVNNAQKNVPGVPLRRLASFRDSLKNYNKERERVQRTMNTSNKTDEYNATFQASNHNKSTKK
jgi:calcium/calmodulin-dependent protein kinase I